MKKLLFLFLILTACSTKPGIDGSEFLGSWVLSESLHLDSDPNKKVTMEISKKDIFFWVKILVNGRDEMAELASATHEDKKMTDMFSKYQLSPDKQTLIPLSGMAEFVIIYHDDNQTIQNSIGWFKKK